MTTYPFSALLDKLGNPTVGPGSRTLGISGAAFNRYRERGLDADQADRLAVSVGFHPTEVWPDWCDGVEYVPDAFCPECGEGFDRGRKDQVYCSMACKHRRKSRLRMRRRATDPAWQERENARKRRYKAEVKAIRVRRMNADGVMSRETIGDNRNAPALRQQPGARPTPTQEMSA